jgi:hypothetical protein
VGRHKVIPDITKRCAYCGKPVTVIARDNWNRIQRNETGLYCDQECHHAAQQVVKRPPKGELNTLIKKLGFAGVGRKFGVSDNAVRKWCLAAGMSTKREDYRRQ